LKIILMTDLRKQFGTLLGIFFLITALRAAPSPVVKNEFIFDTAPFPECHASTIAQTSEGGFVAAWFGGTREGKDDVAIWISRETNGTWTAPAEVVNGQDSSGKRYPCWNPVLFQAPEGPLILFYKVGPKPRSWWGMRTTSVDSGKTWSSPTRLPDGIVGPVKNKPVLLANGDLLCPSSSEHDGWRIHFERTKDLGLTWERTPPLNDGKMIGAIQPSVLFHGDGRLQAVGRSTRDRVFETWSMDQGKTWTPLTLTSLPNPNSGIDALTLRDGRQLVVYNHATNARSPLCIALSTNGIQWEAGLVLDTEPGGELSYPAVIQSRDGSVHVTYTWNRKKIRHVVLDPAKLETRPFEHGAWPR
jgi:predicted neuraminidase